MLNARILGAGLILVAVPVYAVHVAIGCKMCQFIASMLVLFGIAACWRIKSNPETLSGKRILITGCDTGIGRELAERLLACGCVVYAGCYDVNSPGARSLKEAAANSAAAAVAAGDDKAEGGSPQGQLHCLQMDVTSDEQVQQAADFVRKELGSEHKLWAIVNNAGVQYSGDLELTTMRQVRHCMEVNYFGFVRVSQSLLAELRRSHGRLITMSSVRGRCCWPLTGAYTATKFAVEAAMDTWRLELGRFGVAAILIEPSHFGGATGMLNDTQRIVNEFKEQWLAAPEETREAYGEAYVDTVQRAVLQSASISATSLSPIIDTVVESLATDAPRDRYLVAGCSSSSWIDPFKWAAMARDWLPASLHDILIGYMSLAALPPPEQAADWLSSQRQPFFH